MSFVSKYLKYIMILLIICITGGVVYNYYLNSSQKYGMEMVINWGTTGTQTVYDLSLPKDLNYTRLWGNPVDFLLRLNVSEYAKGATPEQTVKLFSDKQSVRSWLGTVQMPNLLHNMLEAVFDMSKDDFNRELSQQVSWGAQTRLQGYVRYSFKRSMDSSANIITITVGDSDGFTTPERVWELVIRVPFNGTDYDVTFTRNPKP